MSDNTPERQKKILFLAEDEGNRIAEAVVFTDQALVKRQVQAQAATGLNRFHVETKAFSLDRDSVQARVYGRGEILSVLFLQVPVQDAPQERLRTLLDEQREKTRERRQLQQRLDTVVKKKKFLDSVVKFSSVQVPQEIQTQLPQAQQLQDLMHFLDGNYNELDQKEDALSFDIEESDRHLKTLERQIKQLQKPAQNTRNVIEVVFRSADEQTIGIEVQYVVGNVSWHPAYKLDVAHDLSAITLTMFARIRQTSGEDWNDIRMTVSNAVPVKGAILPELRPWKLSLHPPMTRAAGPYLGAVAAAAAEPLEETGLSEETDFDDLAASLPEASFQQAQAKETPLSFEYELPLPIQLPSGADETMLPLQTAPLKGSFHHYVIPARDQLTYLVCSAGSDSTLLPGQVNVHFEGRFIGSTTIQEKKAGDRMQFNLGAERAVKVHREKITDRVSETFFGMMDRSSTAREFEYKILIENRKDESVRLHLLDHVPVSQTDKIMVKGLELTPEPAERNWKDREGVMFWGLQIAPGSTQEIRIRFHVKYPRNQIPFGL